MKSIFIKQFLFSFLLLISLNSYSQESNHYKILGSWVFEKIKFLESAEDTVNLKKNLKGMMVTFEKGNKLTMKQIEDTTKRERAGTYKLNFDGSILTQNEQDAKILSLTDEELVLKVEGEFIIYFKKIKSSN